MANLHNSLRKSSA